MVEGRFMNVLPLVRKVNHKKKKKKIKGLPFLEIIQNDLNDKKNFKMALKGLYISENNVEKDNK